MGVETLNRILDALFEGEGLLEAVERDGWPRAMAEEGFAMHRKTWRAPALAAALEGEGAQGRVPTSVAHIWPSLPGAGVTPVLFAYLLGVPEQSIKHASTGGEFARHFVQTWRRFDETLRLDDDWMRAERVVVSGSDETVTAVIDARGSGAVVGYGHRVSFAVVVDDGSPERHLDGLATDIVMWHQAGCFSARAVVFVGSEERGREFSALLARAIGAAERRLGATNLEEGVLAVRMQALGRAQFETSVWPAELGWVELREQWDGRAMSPHAVMLCVGSPEDVVRVPAVNLQGVAWGGPGADDAWRMGVTRVCQPGELQAPPPDWAHDGVGNAAALLGLRSGRIG